MSEEIRTKDQLATPKTDAVAYRARKWHNAPEVTVVPADFAREQERRIAELQRDAARYRWLRHGDNDEAVVRMSGNKRYNYPFLLRNEELDSVIDAKMKEEKS